MFTVRKLHSYKVHVQVLVTRTAAGDYVQQKYVVPRYCTVAGLQNDHSLVFTRETIVPSNMAWNDL